MPDKENLSNSSPGSSSKHLKKVCFNPKIQASIFDIFHCSSGHVHYPVSCLCDCHFVDTTSERSVIINAD